MIGNHRAEGILSQNKQEFEAFKEAAKKYFSVHLDDSEMIVRVVSNDIPKETLERIAIASNDGRNNTFTEAAWQNLKKYTTKIADLASKKIDIKDFKDYHSLKEFIRNSVKADINRTDDASLAFLSYISQDSKNKEGFFNALHVLSRNEEDKVLYRMLIDNAGAFFALKDDKRTNFIPFLSESIMRLANLSKKRESHSRNIQELITLINQTPAVSIREMEKGTNIDFFRILQSEILATALRRSANLEEPSKKLFEKLKKMNRENSDGGLLGDDFASDIWSNLSKLLQEQLEYGNLRQRYKEYKELIKAEQRNSFVWGEDEKLPKLMLENAIVYGDLREIEAMRMNLLKNYNISVDDIGIPHRVFKKPSTEIIPYVEKNLIPAENDEIIAEIVEPEELFLLELQRNINEQMREFGGKTPLLSQSTKDNPDIKQLEWFKDENILKDFYKQAREEGYQFYLQPPKKEDIKPPSELTFKKGEWFSDERGVLNQIVQ
ncbi:hypothetical protein CCZ01_07955, partial [Helicobacter monodelphidis]